MDEARDWQEMRRMSERLLKEGTGADVAAWNRRIAGERFEDEDSLRAWLDRFDSSFVALTGSAEALDQAQRMLGMPPARREGSLVSANYGVSHGAQLWVFTPDDSAHVVYPFGMKREDLAADLAKLARIWPASP